MKRVWILLAIAAMFGACKGKQRPSRKGFRSSGLPVPGMVYKRDAGISSSGRAMFANPQSKADIGRLDLGPPSVVMPRPLGNVRLGIGTEELRKLRPEATFAPSERVAIEEPKPPSMFQSYSYHFEKGKLESVFLTLRNVDAFTDELVGKARSKWGTPSSDPLDRAAAKRYARRGQRIVSWRLKTHLVRLQQVPRSKRMRIYVTQR